jgi:hypothetical protein
MLQGNGQVFIEDLEELFANTQIKKHLRIASQVVYLLFKDFYGMK